MSFRELNDSEFSSLEKLHNQVDNRTLLLFWQFTIEAINEINLVTNQNLSAEMFLIRLLYLKKQKLFQNTNPQQSIEKNINSNQSKTLIKEEENDNLKNSDKICLLYTSPSPRDDR